MNKIFILLFLSYNIIAQTLPKKDNGIALSYNYSNRYLKGYKINETMPVYFITVDFKRNLNINQKTSIKTGFSLFIAGHKDITYNNYKFTARHYYLRVPFLFSFNKNKYYFDFGTSLLLRFTSDSYKTKPTRGSESLSPIGLSSTLELHFGKYIPLKQKRLFLEIAYYASEFYANVVLPDTYYERKQKNYLTNNFQISVGYMFGKLKSNTELIK